MHLHKTSGKVDIFQFQQFILASNKHSNFHQKIKVMLFLYNIVTSIVHDITLSMNYFFVTLHKHKVSVSKAHHINVSLVICYTVLPLANQY